MFYCKYGQMENDIMRCPNQCDCKEKAKRDAEHDREPDSLVYLLIGFGISALIYCVYIVADALTALNDKLGGN